jgi:hypothetical protein
MFDDMRPVDSLLREIKGNTSFLERLLFPNIKLIFVAILFCALIVVRLLIG